MKKLTAPLFGLSLAAALSGSAAAAGREIAARKK